MTTIRATFSMAVVLAVICISGCEGSGTPVTGGKDGDADSQSETASTTSFAGGQSIVVVTYNDMTNDDKVLYTASTRKILSGASLMGWSYSTDRGKKWTYGGKVLPPKGWAVLWGDPAITTCRSSYRHVFMSNLAIPEGKMPPDGISGSVLISGQDSYIGGACIARSTDGGVTFQHYQSVTNRAKNGVPNSEKGHFYDGGSMASTEDGAIYAAFVDIATSQIDIWRSPGPDGDFILLPPPFPGMDIVSHPRLRASPGDSVLYAAAQASNRLVYINRFFRGSWEKPVQASDPVELYPKINFSPGLYLRTGPQFSFDVGASSDGKGSDAIRFLYTRQDPNTKRYYVTASYGPLSLTPCFHSAPEWGTTPGHLNTPGDQFNPNVSAWRGSIGIPPAWKSTYLNRPPTGKDQLLLTKGNLAYFTTGGRFFFPIDVLDNITICPDNRGYWGDYGDLIYLGQNGSSAQFMTTMSSSALGCMSRDDWDSHHLHVQSVLLQ